MYRDEAIRSYVERILELKKKVLICVKEKNLQLALKMFYRTGVKEIHEEIRELNYGIRFIHQKIRLNDNSKISIDNHKEDYILANFDDVLKIIESHPSKEVENYNLLQFENYLDDFLQFFRLMEDNWVIDIPISPDGDFFYNLIHEHLTT